MIKVVAATILKAYVVDVTFADGSRRQVDLEPELWGEVFEPLKDPLYFSKGKFDPDVGTITWPNEADFAPEFLYEHGTVVTL